MIVWIIALFVIAVATESQIYVNINGSDDNNGSQFAPVQSLSRALSLVDKQSDDVTILMSNGIYKTPNDCFLDFYLVSKRLRVSSADGENLLRCFFSQLIR